MLVNGKSETGFIQPRCIAVDTTNKEKRVTVVLVWQQRFYNPAKETKKTAVLFDWLDSRREKAAARPLDMINGRGSVLPDTLIEASQDCSP